MGAMWRSGARSAAIRAAAVDRFVEKGLLDRFLDHLWGKPGGA
jgi:hypothetical protein